MHWLERIWRSFTVVFWNGVVQPKRAAINFVGAGVTVTDNEALDRIDVNIPSEMFTMLDDATPSPTPETLVLRNSFGAASFGGECGFVDILATGDVGCGGAIEADGDIEAVGNLAAGSTSPAYVDMVGGVYVGTTASPTADPVDGFFLYYELGDAKLRMEDGTILTFGSTSTLFDVECASVTTDYVSATSGSDLVMGGYGVTVSSSVSSGVSSDVRLLVPAATTRGNIALLATPGTYANMEGGIFVANRTTAPTGNPTGGGFLYAASGALTWRGSSGTVTTMGPAEPHCPTCGGDFVLDYKHEQLGEELALCLPCLLDDLEAAGVKLRAAFRRKRNPEATPDVRLATGTEGWEEKFRAHEPGWVSRAAEIVAKGE